METGKKKFGLKGGWGFAFASWLAADGKEIALLSGYREQATIKYFDAKDGKELRSVKVPLMNRGAWIARDGSRIASLNDNGDGLIIVDTKTGDEIHRVTGSRLIQAAFSPDGKKLIQHDDSNKVRVHDLDAKKELFAFDHPADKQRGPMLFSKDEQVLYFGGQHGQLFRWDLKNNKKLPDVGRHSTWTLSTIALSPDESILYSMGGDKLIRRWDLKTGKQLPLPDGYITQTAVVPAADGKNLIVVDHAGTLDFWDLANGKHVKQLQPGTRGGFNCVAVSSDGRWFAGGRTLQDVQFWDLTTGKLENTFGLVENPDSKGSDHVQRVFFHPNNKVLFTTSGKTGVTAWEVPGAKKIWNANPGGHFAACDPNGRWVVVGGGFARDKIEFAVLNANTGELIRRLEVQQEVNLDAQAVNYLPYVSDISFTPDGTRLITAHYDGSIRNWAPDSWREVRRLKGNATGNSSICCSPDGRLIGVGRSDKTISIWELETGREVHKIQGHDSPVRDVVFTRDGRGVVGNADLAPVLWSLEPKDLPAVDGLPYLLWEGLKSDDGAKVYKLQWALARNPRVAVKLFEEYVKPAELTVERGQFDKWVADLDSPQFRTREAAERELLRAGSKVPIPWLRKSLADSKADEVRARLGRVLAQREKPDPNEWRLGRAVQALELAGTDAAKALLKSWAEAGGSTLSLNAKAALERMK
jgi:WD40 repeat protein